MAERELSFAEALLVVDKDPEIMKTIGEALNSSGYAAQTIAFGIANHYEILERGLEWLDEYAQELNKQIRILGEYESLLPHYSNLLRYV